jgi:hypothetical protein
MVVCALALMVGVEPTVRQFRYATLWRTAAIMVQRRIKTRPTVVHARVWMVSKTAKTANVRYLRHASLLTTAATMAQQRIWTSPTAVIAHA